MDITEIEIQVNALSHNEFVEALHAHGIAPSEKYGASLFVANDRNNAVKMLIAEITKKKMKSQRNKPQELQSNVCKNCGARKLDSGCYTANPCEECYP